MEEKFDFKVVDLRRVAKVTEGGKRIRVRATVIVGNKNGKVGFATEKGLDVQDAVMKARKKAEKNVVEVPIIEGTVPFEVSAKFGAAEVLIKPNKKGRGLIAGSILRDVLSLAGYTDVSSKILGVTKNPLINLVATFKALEKLKKNYELKQKLIKFKQNASSPNKI